MTAEELLARFPYLPLAGPGWRPLTDPRALRLTLAAMEVGAEGLDAKGKGAFLIGRAMHWQATVLLSLHLAAGARPEGDAAQPISAHDGTLAILPPFSVRRAPAEERRDWLRTTLVESADPLIRSLRRETGLGAAAAWRMASDGIGSAALAVGEAFDCGAVARREALWLLRGAPLEHRTRPTRFMELPHPKGGTRHFLSRAGCCRYYTAPTGIVCHHCVLRPEEEQAELHRAAMREESAQDA